MTKNWWPIVLEHLYFKYWTELKFNKHILAATRKLKLNIWINDIEDSSINLFSSVIRQSVAILDADLIQLYMGRLASVCKRISYPTQCVSTEDLRCGGACIMNSHQSPVLSLRFRVDCDVFRLKRNPFNVQCLKHSLLLLSHLYHCITSPYSVSQNPPWNFLTFFPKRLGIFSPNFTRLLHVSIYAVLQIFIQLPATLTKLCHIKRDHHNVLKMSTIDRNARWVAFNINHLRLMLIRCVLSSF